MGEQRDLESFSILTTLADRKLVAVDIPLVRHPRASLRVKVNRTVNGVVILKFVNVNS